MKPISGFDLLLQCFHEANLPHLNSPTNYRHSSTTSESRKCVQLARESCLRELIGVMTDKKINLVTTYSTSWNS